MLLIGLPLGVLSRMGLERCSRDRILVWPRDSRATRANSANCANRSASEEDQEQGQFLSMAPLSSLSSCCVVLADGQMITMMTLSSTLWTVRLLATRACLLFCGGVHGICPAPGVAMFIRIGGGIRVGSAGVRTGCYWRMTLIVGLVLSPILVCRYCITP